MRSRCNYINVFFRFFRFVPLPMSSMRKEVQVQFVFVYAQEVRVWSSSEICLSVLQQEDIPERELSTAHGRQTQRQCSNLNN